MRHIVHSAIQISLVVSEFKIFGLLSLLERVLHRHGTCTTSHLYYLMVPSVENYRQHSFRILRRPVARDFERGVLFDQKWTFTCMMINKAGY